MTRTLMGRGWVWIAIAGTLVVMLLAGGYLYIGFREAEERAAWEEMNRPFDEVVARFPPTEINDAALKLIELAARIGIALAPDGVRQPPIDEALDRGISEWNTMLEPVEVASPGVNPNRELPPEAVSFLQHHGDVIGEIATLALDQDVIWMSDVRMLGAAPLPKLLESRFLHKVLLIQALAQAREGRVDDAERTLAAAWRLTQSLRRRPELICQLLAIAFDRMLLEVLRRVGSTEDWRPRLAAHHYRESVLLSFQTEVWMFTRPEFAGTTVLNAPYVRLSATNSSEVARRWIKTVSEHQTDCGFDFLRAGKTSLGSIPKWNVVGAIAFPSLGRAWSSAMSTDMERELTILVLEAKKRREAPGGSWEPVDSEICSGWQWRYQSSPEGWTITLSDRPFFVVGGGNTASYTVPNGTFRP